MAPGDDDTRRNRGVLDPDELDISNRPEVQEIDDGRYVVSATGEPAPEPDEEVLENPDWLEDRPDEEPRRDDAAAADASATTDSGSSAPSGDLTHETVSQFLAESLAESDEPYGFDATVNVEGRVNRGRMTSDDIGETMETLLRWYARQADDDLDPEAVLGIILAATDLEVEYPVQSAYEMCRRYGLRPDDSIADLLAAVREEGALTIPPSKRD